ncbi:MAG: hypothetical protein LBT31_09370 [Synergistaceae bacterium]|nr:hypothetical protein [Synergistaceae bacterium]
MNNIKDYYFILGIKRMASPEEVEKAYRFSLKIVNGADYGDSRDSNALRQNVLDDINESYDCLGNPVKRLAYDEGLDTHFPPEPPPAPIIPQSPHYSRETLDLAFATMSRKRSRSLPTLGRFLSALLFLLCVGVGSATGLNYFYTGKYGFPDQNEISALQTRLAERVKTERQHSEPVRVERRPTQYAAAPLDRAHVNTMKAKSRPVTARYAATKKQERYVRVYDIRYGGVITSARAICRKSPHKDAQGAIRMAKNAVVFVTKETRDDDGTIWYYVENNGGEGWLEGGRLKVYK